MKLSDKQAEFARCLAELIAWTNSHEYMRVRFGWVYDPPGTGSSFRSPRSLHRSRLAADLILDILEDGRWVYQRSTEAYRPLGEKWYELHELAEWGGESRNGHPRWDGNHFSFEYGGRW